jgi:hypothetical protein
MEIRNRIGLYHVSSQALRAKDHLRNLFNLWLIFVFSNMDLSKEIAARYKKMSIA